MVALSTLLVNQASALQIQVFAPLNYAGVPPSFPTPFTAWGAWVLNGFAGVDQFSGGTSLSASPGAVGFGIAISWFGTGWSLFQGVTQSGSVHADTWLSGTINALGAGFRVYLFVYRWQLGQPFQVWQKSWGYAIPGAVNVVVDLGVAPIDLSWPSNLPFQWTNNFWYYTRVLMLAFASPNTQANCDAKYEDILYITYAGSPEPHWVQSPGDPAIELNPPMGPVGTNVTVSGKGFAPESAIYIFFDETLVKKTESTMGGDFVSWFNVPDSGTKKGPHVIKAIDTLENMAVSFFDVFITAPPIVGDITGPISGVPDGKTNIRDIALVARNFGKTDPNVDPPKTATVQDISTSMPIIASIAAITVGSFRLRKRHRAMTKQT